MNSRQLLMVAAVTIGIVFPGVARCDTVKHPNLILDHQEIAHIKQKIERQAWAKALFEKLKDQVDHPDKIQNIRGVVNRDKRRAALAALLYALTEEKSYAQIALNWINGRTFGWQQPQKHFIWEIGLEEAVMYDLIYHALTAEQRTRIKDAIRAAGRHCIKYAASQRQTWNMSFLMHAEVGVMGFVTGDKELIEWGMNDPGGGTFEKYTPKRYGGYYQVMQANMKDGGVWHEPNAYLYWHVLPRMVTLVEAASRYYGKNLWQWKSESGSSLKGVFEATLDRAYPLEDFGGAERSLRLVSYGHTGTQHHEITDDPNLNADFFVVNTPTQSSGGLNFKYDLGHLFEIAHHRTGAERCAWLLAANPSRDWTDRCHPTTSVFGYSALLYGREVDADKVKPPSAPSRVFPDSSFAMLRADESPAYWHGRGLSCFFMMGVWPWRSHSHMDSFQITLHGHGRLLYPDVDVLQYEDHPKYGWSHRSISHNTLVVDGGSTSPSPHHRRKDFSSDVKFIAASGSPYQKETQYGTVAVGSKNKYPKNVHLGRALFLTREYLADVFWAKSDQEHVYDWALHGYGELRTSATTEDSNDLDAYRWIKDVRQFQPSRAWSVDWIQTFDKGQSSVGTKMTMLGEPGTTSYLGEGPMYWSDLKNSMHERPKTRYARLPMVAARRRANNVLYAALHEPYQIREKGKAVEQGRIKKYELVQRTDDAIAVKIEGLYYVDYCLVAFAEDFEITQRERPKESKPPTVTLANNNGQESFTFKNFAYIRCTNDGVIVRGELSSLKIPATGPLTINGKRKDGQRDGNVLIYP